MTSSARARIAGGTVRPSAFAVLRLTTSSNLVGCSTGMSLDTHALFEEAGLELAALSDADALMRSVVRSRLLALEDLSGESADLTKGGREAGSVGDQRTCSGEFTPWVYCRNGIPHRQSHMLLAPAEEERIGGDDERAGMQMDKGCEDGLDFAFGPGLDDMKRAATRCALEVTGGP